MATSESMADRKNSFLSILWRKGILVLRIAQVRLRFFVVLVVAFVVIGQWDTLRNYSDKLTRAPGSAIEAVSPDTEYWCPMCPGVLSDWPGKCSVCNMALVRRQRGEAVPLPDGVLARMQLSPYRMQLAGIQTSAITYRPLVHEIMTAGFVDADSGQSHPSPGPLKTIPVHPDNTLTPLWVNAAIFDKDYQFLKVGQVVDILSEAFPGHDPFAGKVQKVDVSPLSNGVPSLHVRIEIANPQAELRPGLFVTARIQVPIVNIEPFRSIPVSAPPLKAGELRQVYVCRDHPDRLYDKPGRCPRDTNELEARLLATNQRLGWWCPMHPQVTADKPGGECRACQGMKLVPRVITYNPPGEVLTVPESALIDTGARRVVYIERAPGMFEGVAVVVGPRCGDFYPIIRGLEAGQRVATAGAFLIDAETRLNPSVAAGYFGAAQGATERRDSAPSTAPRSETTPEQQALLKLSPADRTLAARQKVCPVTGELLGSMGTPMRVVVAGKTLFLCCEGCESAIRKNPAKYLSKIHD